MKRLVWMFVAFGVLTWTTCCAAQTPTHSKWVCDQTVPVACTIDASDKPRSDKNIEIKMSEIIDVYAAVGCSVRKLSGELDGDLGKQGVGNVIGITVLYDCLTSPNMNNNHKTKESAHETFKFDCDEKMFQFFSSGFDHFSDGHFMHWDSLYSTWDPRGRKAYWEKMPSNRPARVSTFFPLMCN